MDGYRQPASHRLRRVTKLVETYGGRLKIVGADAFVVLPDEMADTLTSEQAWRVAEMMHFKLGKCVAVYVENEAGRTLGKAGLPGCETRERRSCEGLMLGASVSSATLIRVFPR